MARASAGSSGRERRSITVGADFTTGSRIAVERAALLAETTNARLQIVHVVAESARWPAMPLPSQWTSDVAPGAQPNGEAALEAAVELTTKRLATESPKAVNVVRVGVPHEMLARCAASQKSFALVIGVHRPLSPGESFFLGTTAERALRDGSTPVLLARTRVTGPYRHALVALELGELSLRVAKSCATLVPDAEYDVIHFLPPLGLKGKNAKLQREDAREKLVTLCAGAGMDTARCRFHVLTGSPRAGILAEIGKHMPDVVVMGTHARKGLARMLIGSVADYVIHSAWSADVLAVPPEA